MQKCVGVGYDGTTTMMGQRLGMAIKLKKISPFLTSIHCIAHRTNLAALEVAKSTDYKAISTEIDILLNSLAAYFRNSGKKNDAQKP